MCTGRRLNGQRLDRVVLPVGRALGRDEHSHLRETHFYIERSCQVCSPYRGSHSLLSGHRRVIPAERHILRLQAAAVLHEQRDLQAGIVQFLAQEIARFPRRRQAHLLHLFLQSCHRISRNGCLHLADQLGCQIDQSAGDRGERPVLHRQAVQRGIACHIHIFQVRAGGECVLADARHRFGDGNAVHAAACARKRIGRNTRYGIGHAAHRHRLRDLCQRAASSQRGVIGGEDALRRALHRLKAERAAGDVLQNGDVQLGVNRRLVLQCKAQLLAARRFAQRLHTADGSSVDHRERIFVRRQRLFGAIRQYLLDGQVGQIQRIAKEILRFYIRTLLQLQGGDRLLRRHREGLAQGVMLHRQACRSLCQCAGNGKLAGQQVPLLLTVRHKDLKVRRIHSIAGIVLFLCGSHLNDLGGDPVILRDRDGVACGKPRIAQSDLLRRRRGEHIHAPLQGTGGDEGGAAICIGDHSLDAAQVQLISHLILLLGAVGVYAPAFYLFALNCVILIESELLRCCITSRQAHEVFCSNLGSFEFHITCKGRALKLQIFFLRVSIPILRGSGKLPVCSVCTGIDLNAADRALHVVGQIGHGGQIMGLIKFQNELIGVLWQPISAAVLLKALRIVVSPMGVDIAVKGSVHRVLIRITDDRGAALQLEVAAFRCALIGSELHLDMRACQRSAGGLFPQPHRRVAREGALGGQGRPGRAAVRGVFQAGLNVQEHILVIVRGVGLCIADRRSASCDVDGMDVFCAQEAEPNVMLLGDGGKFLRRKLAGDLPRLAHPAGPVGAAVQRILQRCLAVFIAGVQRQRAAVKGKAGRLEDAALQIGRDILHLIRLIQAAGLIICDGVIQRFPRQRHNIRFGRYKSAFLLQAVDKIIVHGQRIPFQCRSRFLCQRIVVLVCFSCLLIRSCKSVKGGEVKALRLQCLLIQRDGILGFSICQRDLRHIGEILCLGVIRAVLAAHSVHAEEDVRAVIIAGIGKVAPAAGDVGMAVVLAGALLDVVDIIAMPPHHLAVVRRILRIPIVGQMCRLSQRSAWDAEGIEGNGAGTGDVDAHTAHLQPDPHGRIILPFCRCPLIPRLAGAVGQVEIEDLVMEGEGVFIIPLLPVFLSKVRAADIIGGQEARDLVREHESVSRNILRLHLLWRGGIGLRGFLPDLGADVVMRPLELIVIRGRAHHKAHFLHIQLGELHCQHLVQIPVLIDLIPLHRLGLAAPVEAHHAGVHPPVVHGNAVGQGKRRHHPLIERLIFTVRGDIRLVLGIELAQHREAVQIVLCCGCLIGVIPSVCLRLAAVDIAAQHLGIAEQPLHARSKVRILLHFRGQRVIARLFHQPALEQQCFVGRVCCFFRRSSAELRQFCVIPREGQDILTVI